MIKILSIGDIIWDIYPDKSTIGGSALNFAAHVGQLKEQSFIMSAVGEDSLGAAAKAELERFSVSCKYLQKNANPTGQCIVTLDENKIPTFRVLDNAAYDYIETDNGIERQLESENFAAVYFGTVPQRNHVTRRTMQSLLTSVNLGIKFCDLNLRKNCYDEQSVRYNLSHADILKISDEEEPLCRELGLYTCAGTSYEEITRAVSDAFPNLKIIILTLGAEGSFALDTGSGDTYFQPALKVDAVSTVGAGDSFSAAWLCSYLEGKSIADCMRKAAEISAFVVAHTEAVPVY